MSRRIDCLRDAAHAAHVPDSDRDGPGSEPVTVSGWYEVPTVSGRRAWQRYDWRDGQCVQGVCTYDLCAEDAYRDADAAMDWDAQTGEQGLTSVTYEVGRYSDDIAAEAAR